MALSNEEKEKRREERRRKKWLETHATIEGIDHKKCSICEKYFPSDVEYFYKNKGNGVDGLDPYCKSCASKKSVKWQKENPEEFKAWVKHYNTTEIRKEQKRHEWRNGRKRGRLRDWQQINPIKVAGYNGERRKKNHDISQAEWDACRLYFDYRCAYCGMTYEEQFANFNKDLNRDHYGEDGSNNLSNCIPACTPCNSSKWKLNAQDWYNINNINYSEERISRIIGWLDEDYHKFIKIRKSK